jgi:hypothetical protein
MDRGSGSTVETIHSFVEPDSLPALGDGDTSGKIHRTVSTSERSAERASAEYSERRREQQEAARPVRRLHARAVPAIRFDSIRFDSIRGAGRQAASQPARQQRCVDITAPWIRGALMNGCVREEGRGQRQAPCWWRPTEPVCPSAPRTHASGSRVVQSEHIVVREGRYGTVRYGSLSRWSVGGWVRPRTCRRQLHQRYERGGEMCTPSKGCGVPT